MSFVIFFQQVHTFSITHNCTCALQWQNCKPGTFWLLLRHMVHTALPEELVWIPRTHIRWFTTRESDAPFWPLRALTYTSALTHMCTNTHMYTHTRASTHTCTHTHVYSRTHVHIYTHILNTHSITHVPSTHGHSHMCTYTQICLYTHTFTKRNLHRFLKW